MRRLVRLVFTVLVIAALVFAVIVGVVVVVSVLLTIRAVALLLAVHQEIRVKVEDSFEIKGANLQQRHWVHL